MRVCPLRAMILISGAAAIVARLRLVAIRRVACGERLRAFSTSRDKRGPSLPCCRVRAASNGFNPYLSEPLGNGEQSEQRAAVGSGGSRHEGTPRV